MEQGEEIHHLEWQHLTYPWLLYIEHEAWVKGLLTETEGESTVAIAGNYWDCCCMPSLFV